MEIVRWPSLHNARHAFMQARITGDFRILFLDVEAGTTSMPHGTTVPARTTAKVRHTLHHQTQWQYSTLC
jgi:hypothetical protein